MPSPTDHIDTVVSLRTTGEPFAVATVVRTVSMTAAKAGAKAVIRRDGSISEGWIGGGCARAAVLKAAREALADGRARLVSVQPKDLLEQNGVSAGEERDGIRYVKNMCPSQGTMDVFVEPVLPRPQLVVCGSSPVAVAIAELAPRFGFSVTAAAPAGEQAAFADVEVRFEGYDLPERAEGRRFIVVATQGNGDSAALKGALAVEAHYVGFVASRRKVAVLRERFLSEGIAADVFDRVHAPAGLDLGAITPEEIALSILAEVVAVRRRGIRPEPRSAA